MIRPRLFRLFPFAAALLLAGLAACQPVASAREVARLPAPAVDAAPTTAHDEVAVFAGGCFWGIEAVFERVKGVRQVTAGYSGGAANTAHYDEVSGGDTGHGESVQVEFVRIEYDIARTMEAIRASELPNELAEFLRTGGKAN